jgi:hypothetical protein
MARSKTASAGERMVELLDPEPAVVEVRHFRLKGGGLLRMECSPPGAGTVPDGAQEIDEDTYTREHADAAAALERHLNGIADAEAAALQAHRQQLEDLGVTGKLADILLGNPGGPSGGPSGGAG